MSTVLTSAVPRVIVGSGERPGASSGIPARTAASMTFLGPLSIEVVRSM